MTAKKRAPKPKVDKLALLQETLRAFQAADPASAEAGLLLRAAIIQGTAWLADSGRSQDAGHMWDEVHQIGIYIQGEKRPAWKCNRCGGRAMASSGSRRRWGTGIMVLRSELGEMVRIKHKSTCDVGLKIAVMAAEVEVLS